MFFQRLYLKFAIIHFMITPRIYFCNRLCRIQKGLFVTKPAEIDLPAGRQHISLLSIGSICLGDVTVELEEGK